MLNYFLVLMLNLGLNLRNRPILFGNSKSVDRATIYVSAPGFERSPQCDLFSQAILENTAVPTPLEDALANMQTIDAELRSGKSGGWEMPITQ